MNTSWQVFEIEMPKTSGNEGGLESWYCGSIQANGYVDAIVKANLAFGNPNEGTAYVVRQVD